MQAEELRLGNKIYCDDLDIDTGKWVQKIIDVGYRDIYNLINGNDMVKGSYEGIPITKEWLFKFGFEVAETTHNYTMVINGFYLGINKNGSVDMDYGEYKDIATVKYVHQLQNLIYALTNEELNVSAIL